MTIDHLAPDEPLSPELVCGTQAWRDDYPWLHRAFKEIGPGARAAADGWRVRIEDELKATLDFKVRPDGTAAVWCGMSAYDFQHDPTPKELLEGLADAYRRELKCVGGNYPTRAATWKMSGGAPTAPGQALVPSGPVSFATRGGAVRTGDTFDPLLQLGAVLLPRVVQLMLIFVGVTALTLVLFAIANAVR